MSHDLELPEMHSVQDIDLLMNKAYDAIISAVATSKLVQEGRCLPSDHGLGFLCTWDPRGEALHCCSA